VPRVGPGTGFRVHESGTLFAFETVYVLQECAGWVQGRVMSIGNVYANGYRNVVDAASKKRADEMLTFWVRADLIRR